MATPDDQVAAELEAAAKRALRRGAPALAAAALERAAPLTTEDHRRGQLLIDAAWVSHELGQHTVSMPLLREAQQLELAPTERTILWYVLETFEQKSWSGAARIRPLVEIAEQLQAVGETDRALDALSAVSLRCWWGNPDEETRDLAVAAAERLPVREDNPALLAIIAQADPAKRGGLVADRLAAVTAADVRDPVAACELSVAAHAVWAHQAAFEFGAVAIDGFRSQGRLGWLAQALVNQA